MTITRLNPIMKLSDLKGVAGDLPEKASARYAITMDSFADGGTLYWTTTENLLNSLSTPVKNQSQLGLTITPKSGYSVSNVSGRRYGRVVVAYMDVYHTSALNTGSGFSPMSTNLQPAIVSSDNAVGYVVASQNMWLKTLGALASNSTFGIVVVGILP